METHPLTGQKLQVIRKFAVCWGPIQNVSEAPYVIAEVETRSHPGHQDQHGFYLVPAIEFVVKPSFLLEEKNKRAPKFITYSTLEEARKEVEKLIRWAFEFEERKGRLDSFTEEEVKAKCAEIQEILLP